MHGIYVRLLQLGAQEVDLSGTKHIERKQVAIVPVFLYLIVIEAHYRYQVTSSFGR